MQGTPIRDVSDTAFMVAALRGMEGEREAPPLPIPGWLSLLVRWHMRRFMGYMLLDRGGGTSDAQRG